MIYLNNAAGTKPYESVINTIEEVLKYCWGNPHDSTSFGHEAQMVINNATDRVAEDINCSADEIIWTSGACEANSLAIMGLLNNNPNMHFYTSFLEHTSINEIVRSLPHNKTGFISNDKFGRLDLESLKKKMIWNCAHDIKTLVSISYANSEMGVVQDIKAIAEIVHKYDGILHVDATQYYGCGFRIDVDKLGIDMMSVSGQKLHCVKGVGFLYVKNGIQLKPLIFGSQQNGIRGGTMPTHLIAAFGEALRVTRNETNSIERMIKLKEHMDDHLRSIKGAHINDTTTPSPYYYPYKLPNVTSVTIEGINAGTLVTMCDLVDQIIIGKGSACQAYESKPSQTLLALGLTEEQAESTIRISIDSSTTQADVDRAIDVIEQLVPQIKRIS